MQHFLISSEGLDWFSLGFCSRGCIYGGARTRATLDRYSDRTTVVGDSQNYLLNSNNIIVALWVCKLFCLFICQLELTDQSIRPLFPQDTVIRLVNYNFHFSKCQKVLERSFCIDPKVVRSLKVNLWPFQMRLNSRGTEGVGQVGVFLLPHAGFMFDLSHAPEA